MLNVKESYSSFLEKKTALFRDKTKQASASLYLSTRYPSRRICVYNVFYSVLYDLYGISSVIIL